MTSVKTVFMRLSLFVSKTLARSVNWCFWALFLACVLIRPKDSAADLVSPYGGETAPNFAELLVEDGRVRVALEIDLGDYPFFVAPDDGTGRALATRTGRTFGVAADGKTLTPVVRSIDVRRRTPRLTAASKVIAPRPRSEDVVFVEMEFQFQGQPTQITFTPPLNESGIPLASIGMVAEHLGVPVTDYRYLSRPETMLPNWEDPWFTTFENPNLTRHHKSPLMSFLSMEPREVRHEIIFRLKDFEAWADLNLGAAERLSPGQVALVKSEAASFFEQHNPLSINGTSVMPRDVQVSQIAVGADGLRVLPDEAEAQRTTMLMGAVLSYPNATLADRVDMTWQLFPDGTDIIPVTLSDPAGAVPSQIYKSDPTVVWNNHLTSWENPITQPVVVKSAGLVSLPMLSIGFGLAALICAGLALRTNTSRRTVFAVMLGAFTTAALLTIPIRNALPMMTAAAPDEVTTHQVVQGLLGNLSVAMLEPDIKGVEAALEPFVTPDNRDQIRDELRRGLSVSLPSGALAKTDKIVDLRIEGLSSGEDRNSHQIIANWTARVSGGHWGHLHQQSVLFRGLMNVSRHGDQWHLDGLTVLNAQKQG
ncbi:hypothetical protein [Ruegeria sp. HKCCD7221]|uniref:hypothetical protein n=1 Tax=Ruegeria sp. HKCCD7221 TaxID=2683009 RepID=UPI001489A104|nr:hypothetical protein [Ruegeria sp. HKCCD7221]